MAATRRDVVRLASAVMRLWRVMLFPPMRGGSGVDVNRLKRLDLREIVDSGVDNHDAVGIVLVVREAGAVHEVVDSGVLDVAQERLVVDVAVGVEIGVSYAVRLYVAVIVGVVTDGRSIAHRFRIAMNPGFHYTEAYDPGNHHRWYL